MQCVAVMQDLMKGAPDTPNVVEACNLEGRQERLDGLLSQLEMCEKALQVLFSCAHCAAAPFLFAWLGVSNVWTVSCVCRVHRVLRVAMPRQQWAQVTGSRLPCHRLAALPQAGCPATLIAH